MQTGHSLDTNRSGFLPWMLVILFVLGIGGFVVREPLARMIAPPAAPAAANPGPGLTGGGVLLSIQELSNLESVAFHFKPLFAKQRTRTVDLPSSGSKKGSLSRMAL